MFYRAKESLSKAIPINHRIIYTLKFVHGPLGRYRLERNVSNLRGLQIGSGDWDSRLIAKDGTWVQSAVDDIIKELDRSLSRPVP